MSEESKPRRVPHGTDVMAMPNDVCLGYEIPAAELVLDNPGYGRVVVPTMEYEPHLVATAGAGARGQWLG
jgi:hypothetical protein